jgi:flavin-dependent dehydrogenase
MALEFDIAVVGGGPAGAATALCLARSGWRVAVLERRSFDQPAAGETLPPEINPVLRSLGLWETFLSQSPLESPGIVSIWGSSVPSELDFTENAFGCGWHVDRKRFDQMLCRQAVNAGAKLFLNSDVAFARRTGCWQAGDFCAKFLVDATGRNGLLLEGKRDREKEDSLLAIVLRLSNWKRQPQDLRTCIEATPAGWWYSTLLPGQDAVAMFFTGAELYRKVGISITEQLQAASLTRRRLEGGCVEEARVVHAPSGRRKNIFGAGWVAVGDSASSYDPLSGRGVFKALRHGQAAAQAIDAQLRGDPEGINGYAARVKQEFEQYASQRSKYYSLEQRWADEPFWRFRRRARNVSPTEGLGPSGIDPQGFKSIFSII